MKVKDIVNAVAKAVDAIYRTGAHKATVYLDEKFTVKATEKLYKGKRKGYGTDILLTLGRPNYAQRQFIKLCKKATVPFPIKKIQLQFPPKKRK